MVQAKMEEKAKIDYDITSDRWSKIVSVIKLMLIVLSFIYITCIVLSLMNSQIIAALMLSSLQVINLIGLNSIRNAREAGTIKKLALPLRILAMVLGVIY